MNTRELIQDTTKRALQKYHDIHTKKLKQEISGLKDIYAATISMICKNQQKVNNTLEDHKNEIKDIKDTLMANTSLIFNKFNDLSNLNQEELNYITE